MALKMISDLIEVDDSQMEDDALIEGAIPPTSGSIFTPVKVTLAKLAKWIVGTYEHSALVTTAETIAGAIAEHESDISSLNGSLGGVSFNTGTVSSGASTTIAMGAGLIITFRGSNNGSIYGVSGTANVTNIVSNSTITVTTTGTEVTLSNNATAAIRYVAIIVN